jgi:hypothetical protein
VGESANFWSDDLFADLLVRAGCHCHSPVMTTARRVLIADRVVLGSLRRWQPQTHWQAWMSAGGLPLAALVIGIGLGMVFHTWPTFDVPGSIIAAGYIALVGGRQSLALRARHRAQRRIAGTRS